MPETCLYPTLSHTLGEAMEADSRQGEWVTARSQLGGRLSLNEMTQAAGADAGGRVVAG